jgi:hypothetical protein
MTALRCRIAVLCERQSAVPRSKRMARFRFARRIPRRGVTMLGREPRTKVKAIDADD